MPRHEAISRTSYYRICFWRVCFRRQQRPRQVTGDTTCGTAEIIVGVEDAGIRAFFQLPDFDARTPFFGKGKFVYEGSVDASRVRPPVPVRLHRRANGSPW